MTFNLLFVRKLMELQGLLCSQLQRQVPCDFSLEDFSAGCLMMAYDVSFAVRKGMERYQLRLQDEEALQLPNRLYHLVSTMAGSLVGEVDLRDWKGALRFSNWRNYCEVMSNV